MQSNIYYNILNACTVHASAARARTAHAHPGLARRAQFRRARAACTVIRCIQTSLYIGHVKSLIPYLSGRGPLNIAEGLGLALV